MNNPIIALKCDIDWPLEAIIQDTLNILSQFNAEAILFARHQSDVLQNVDSSKFEIGIYPNFNGLLNGVHDSNYKKVIDDTLKLYPLSIGTEIGGDSLVYSKIKSSSQQHALIINN